MSCASCGFLRSRLESQSWNSFNPFPIVNRVAAGVPTPRDSARLRQDSAAKDIKIGTKLWQPKFCISSLLTDLQDSGAIEQIEKVSWRTPPVSTYAACKACHTLRILFGTVSLQCALWFDTSLPAGRALVRPMTIETEATVLLCDDTAVADSWYKEKNYWVIMRGAVA